MLAFKPILSILNHAVPLTVSIIYTLFQYFLGKTLKVEYHKGKVLAARKY